MPEVGSAGRESGNGVSVLILRAPGRTGVRKGIGICTGRPNERQGVEGAGRELRPRNGGLETGSRFGRVKGRFEIPVPARKVGR